MPEVDVYEKAKKKKNIKVIILGQKQTSWSSWDYLQPKILYL